LKKAVKRDGEHYLHGLPALYAQIQREKKAKADAKAIFRMVTEESGTTTALRERVTRDSLLQLIFLCIDLTATSRAKAAAGKSHEDAIADRRREQKRLHDWLKPNIHRFRKNLVRCAMAAQNEGKVSRSLSWISKEITAYRKTQ